MSGYYLKILHNHLQTFLRAFDRTDRALRLRYGVHVLPQWNTAEQDCQKTYVYIPCRKGAYKHITSVLSNMDYAAHSWPC
jgi:hypothetical protein